MNDGGKVNINKICPNVRNTIIADYSNDFSFFLLSLDVKLESAKIISWIDIIKISYTNLFFLTLLNYYFNLENKA